MTRGYRYATVALAGVVLAACSVDDIPGQGQAINGTYECDNDKTFSVATASGSDQVAVDFEGQSHLLKQQDAYSGRYEFSDGDLLLWVSRDGRFAALEGAAESYSNCLVIALGRGDDAS